MVIYATFNTVSVISRAQFTCSYISWVPIVQGLAKDTPKKTQMIEPGPSKLGVIHCLTVTCRTPLFSNSCKVCSCTPSIERLQMGWC